MWVCKECGRQIDKLLIQWGTCDGQKVDVLDVFCPFCPSDSFRFIGTKKEEDKYWDDEWNDKPKTEEKQNEYTM